MAPKPESVHSSVEVPAEALAMLYVEKHARDDMTPEKLVQFYMDTYMRIRGVPFDVITSSQKEPQ